MFYALILLCRFALVTLMILIMSSDVVIYQSDDGLVKMEAVVIAASEASL